MDPCRGNWLAIGRAVVYYAWAAHTYSAGIKCRHCTYPDRRRSIGVHQGIVCTTLHPQHAYGVENSRGRWFGRTSLNCNCTIWNLVSDASHQVLITCICKLQENKIQKLPSRYGLFCFCLYDLAFHQIQNLLSIN